MNIKILAFGIAKDIFGAPSVDLILQGAPTVAALKDKLEERYPRLKSISSYVIAVNNEYAADPLPLKADDEIAIIPPVSGG